MVKRLAGLLVGATFWIVSAQGIPPGESFDIEGIHLGMPLKEAMATLRTHNAHLQLVPDSVSYAGLRDPLTYGINAVGGGEGFYFLVAMPPNQVVVSRLTWVQHFAGENVPTQDAVVASLARKYGRISWDTTAGAFLVGTRDLYWIEDEQGHRIQGQPQARCLGQSTFFMNGLRPGTKRWDPVSVRLPPIAARLRIEQGFVNREDPIAEQCAKVSMVHARLFPASLMGARVPNLVEYLVLMISSGPLDRRTTEATHEYWLAKAKRSPSGAATPRAPSGVTGKKGN